MDLKKIQLFVKDQFPEFYREEYPQLVQFITKYYEYLDSTKYSIMDNLLDVDNTLDEFVLELKKQFAVNIPEFGKLSDRDFLLFSKEFYSSRGSKDSYKFLFRALYGKEVELLYPGDSVLRASDGVWNQEKSIRIISQSVAGQFSSGNGVQLSAADLTGRSFDIVSQTGSKIRTECIRVNRLSDQVYDVVIPRTFSALVESGDQLQFKATYDEVLESGEIEQIDLLLTGSIINTPKKLKPTIAGSNFVVGSFYTIPSQTNLSFRIKKVGDSGQIFSAEIIQLGYDDAGSIKQYIAIDPANRDYFETSDDPIAVTGNRAVLKIEQGAGFLYPGFYTSAKGFLSDSIKLQNDYYQQFSYVIRLDEQLESYKTIVKRLLHPAGTELWAEYNLSTLAATKTAIESIIDALLFVEDDMFIDDETRLHTTLAVLDYTTDGSEYALGYFGGAESSSYTIDGSGYAQYYFANTDLSSYVLDGSGYDQDYFSNAESSSYTVQQDLIDFFVQKSINETAIVQDAIQSIEIEKPPFVSDVTSPDETNISVETGFSENGLTFVDETRLHTTIAVQDLVDLHEYAIDYFAEKDLSSYTVQQELIDFFVQKSIDETAITQDAIQSFELDKSPFVSDVNVPDAINISVNSEFSETIAQTDDAVFSAIFDKSEILIVEDAGRINLLLTQTYSGEAYFLETGLDAYAAEEITLAQF